MVSLEEAARDTTLNSKNLTLIHKRIILSIREIDWKNFFSYSLRDGFSAEELKLDYSAVLMPISKNSEKKSIISFSVLIEGGDFKITNCSNEKIQKIIEKTIRDCLGYNTFKPLSKVEIGKKYKHYKGGEYVVLNISRHTEQDEELVNYHKIGESEIWSRPKAMFMDGRFQPIN